MLDPSRDTAIGTQATWFNGSFSRNDFERVRDMGKNSEKRTRTIWMIECAPLGKDKEWSTTGRDYFFTRGECLAEIATLSSGPIRYRAMKYTPAVKSKRSR